MSPPGTRYQPITLKPTNKRPEIGPTDSIAYPLQDHPKYF